MKTVEVKLRRGGKVEATLVAELPDFVVGDGGKHLAVKADGSGVEWVAPFALPALPADAATKTYALQAVNGVLTWVAVA